MLKFVYSHANHDIMINKYDFGMRCFTMNIRVTVVVQKEDNWYVTKCLENSIASQGSTIEESLDNLREALELFYGDTTPEHPNVPTFITTIEVPL